MPSTPQEARRATKLEELARQRALTAEEMEEYRRLAVLSYQRLLGKRD